VHILPNLTFLLSAQGKYNLFKMKIQQFSNLDVEKFQQEMFKEERNKLCPPSTGAIVRNTSPYFSNGLPGIDYLVPDNFEMNILYEQERLQGDKVEGTRCERLKDLKLVRSRRQTWENWAIEDNNMEIDFLSVQERVQKVIGTRLERPERLRIANASKGIREEIPMKESGIVYFMLEREYVPVDCAKLRTMFSPRKRREFILDGRVVEDEESVIEYQDRQAGYRTVEEHHKKYMEKNTEGVLEDSDKEALIQEILREIDLTYNMTLRNIRNTMYWEEFLRTMLNSLMDES